MNNKKPWISNAHWPVLNTMKNRPILEFSTDRHETKEQAEAVCTSLERDGLGGEGKVFPLKTWVSNVKDRPY
jgi:hypothetical protein